jgi:hypothetical protein
LAASSNDQAEAWVAIEKTASTITIENNTGFTFIFTSFVHVDIN